MRKKETTRDIIIETRTLLNNHLAHHEKLTLYVLAPILVIVTASFITIILKSVL